MGSDDTRLVNLFWSSAGVLPGEGEISPFDFIARVRSAARAGFGGLSFWHTDLDHILESHSIGEVKAILNDHDIGAYEVEFIEDWFIDGERRAASDLRRRRLFDVAAFLGAHHVKVGDFRNTPVEMPRLIESFRALCEDAARSGLTIGFEFMASSMIHRLEDCLTMVNGADASNGGLIVDIAHTNALDISNEEVGSIPGRFLVSIELGDNLRRESAGYDPVARRYCGEGELDVAGFVAAARRAGYHGPWAVEVINPAHRDWPLERLDEDAYRTTLPYVIGKAP